ncbi:PREDICTED: ADP-dependent glucokinase-like isoform X2 [Priapulus caudatus]|nr:PREDICTED: ADP-dependent glucokinase-like isoform X2 [Priapulus caudatus]
MSNSTLFSEMIAIGAQLPGAHWALGGNAPVMASRFNLEGCEVLLGTKMSEDLKSYFDPRIKISGGNLASDDIHLILEYKSGDSWGKLTAARANRFIVHSDLNNPTISSLNDFTAELKSFHPQLLVIGGLQMMDNFPFKPGQRREILQKIRNTILDLSCWTRLHFEMASFTDESLLQDLAELVFPYIDSFGMNEQELPNLYAALYKKNISLVSDTYPRVATVLDQMREVFRVVNTRQNQRGCEQHARIHVHTLAYQVIMTRHGSSWKNNLGAAAKASLTANRHTCGSGEIDVAKARLILDNSFASSKHDGGRRIHIDDGKPVSCWREEGVHICVAPVLVCTEVLQTAGGGDTISSAALAYQI